MGLERKKRDLHGLDEDRHARLQPARSGSSRSGMVLRWGEGDKVLPRDGRPTWSDDAARTLLGRHIVIGITRLSADDQLLEQRQMHGDIVEVDGGKGIGIRLAGTGEMYWLPPDLSAIRVAKPGEYRFRSTGEVVVNPDLMTTWTVKEPRRH